MSADANMTPVAVLGCGPAGLLAAHACNMAGIPVCIISEGKRSGLGGAQFLHAPIPGIHRALHPDTMVSYERRGDPDIYKKKAFSELPVEWKPWTEGGQPAGRAAWSLESTYDMLWDGMEEVIHDERNMVKVDMDWLESEADQFLFIVNSIPLRALCVNPDHKFITQAITIAPGVFEAIEDDHVLYDGTGDKSWYRTSRIFGCEYTEWGHGAKVPPGLQTFKDYKPMSTDCDCLQTRFPRLLSVGRRGKWSAREFTHDAFYDTIYTIGRIYGR